MRDVLGTFWAKVDTTGDCWEWNGARDIDGYGIFSHKHRGNVRAHRFVIELVTRQPIPDGLCALHNCDNPACVNPTHLRLGDRRDNMRDCLERGRHPNTNRTHCRHGHRYDEANTARRSDGSRRCRTCDRISRRRYVEARS